MATSIIYRIDDRLIHGQVLVGWAGHYPIETIIIANDEIAESDWEKELVLMAAPSTMNTDVLTIEAAVQFIQKYQGAENTAMVLVSAPEDIKKIHEAGIALSGVNLGGLHYSEGRKEYLPYLFLTDEEVHVLKEMMTAGVRFECLDVPSGTKYNLAKLLG